jgi:hypothetical protein
LIDCGIGLNILHKDKHFIFSILHVFFYFQNIRRNVLFIDREREFNHSFEEGVKKYSQTCIKRSPLGQRKSGLLRQVTA